MVSQSSLIIFELETLSNLLCPTPTAAADSETITTEDGEILRLEKRDGKRVAVRTRAGGKGSGKKGVKAQPYGKASDWKGIDQKAKAGGKAGGKAKGGDKGKT